MDKPDRGQSPGKWHQKPVEGRASTRGRVSVKTALVQKLDQRVVTEYLKYVYFFFVAQIKFVIFTSLKNQI